MEMICFFPRFSIIEEERKRQAFIQSQYDFALKRSRVQKIRV